MYKIYVNVRGCMNTCISAVVDTRVHGVNDVCMRKYVGVEIQVGLLVHRHRRTAMPDLAPGLRTTGIYIWWKVVLVPYPPFHRIRAGPTYTCWFEGGLRLRNCAGEGWEFGPGTTCEFPPWADPSVVVRCFIGWFE